MKPLHVGFAVAAVILWGGAFVAIEFGLDSFSPSQLTVLRFAIGGLPALFLPRPRIAWGAFLAIGLTLFAGQFLLLFYAYANGMPPGLASIVMQIQAFFTVLIAALTLGDVPTRRQIAGMAVAFLGLAVVGATIGGGLTWLGLVLALAAAFSWAVGNVLVKRTVAAVPILPLVAWLSLVPPLPALLLSTFVAGDPSLPDTLADASWLSIAAAVYLGLAATTLAYALWGDLLRKYSTASVAPFALLAPCVGVAASAAVFDEQFGAGRYAGMALILAGLAVVTLPVGRLFRRGASGPAGEGR